MEKSSKELQASFILSEKRKPNKQKIITDWKKKKEISELFGLGFLI